MCPIYDCELDLSCRSIQIWSIKYVCRDRSGPIYDCELDPSCRSIQIWRIKYVCRDRSGPIYDCELDSSCRSIQIWSIKYVCLGRAGPIYYCELDPSSKIMQNPPSKRLQWRGIIMNPRFYTLIVTINVLDGRIIYFLHHLSIYS